MCICYLEEDAAPEILPPQPPRRHTSRVVFRIYSKCMVNITAAKSELEEHVKRYHRRTIVTNEFAFLLYLDESYYEDLLDVENEMVAVVIG